jgi:hypothetical protein
MFRCGAFRKFRPHVPNESTTKRLANFIRCCQTSHPPPRRPRPAENELDKKRMDVRLRQFLSQKAQQTGRSVKTHWKKVGLPNMEHMKALDQALTSSIGYGLSHFVCRKPPKPLSMDQERYYVPASDLPPAAASDLGLDTRSCILDVKFGKRYLEVILGLCLDISHDLGPQIIGSECLSNSRVRSHPFCVGFFTSVACLFWGGFVVEPQSRCPAFS